MTAAPELRIQIPSDRSTATLVVPANADPAALRLDALMLLVKAAGVRIDAAGEAALASIAGEGSAELERCIPVASAIPPVAGINGRIEWAPGFGPQAKTQHETAADRTDHYAGTHYAQVKAGDLVAVLVPPTGGTDGSDVCGGAIRATPGRPAPFRLGRGLSQDSSGRITAQLAGVLMLRNGEVSISESLQIPGAVDFAVGHVEFAGSVSIAGGVCSGFHVTVGGNLQIGRLVEAAQLSCAGDLILHGGMAGHDTGTIHAGGNVHAVYLEKVRGEIKGSLTIDREMVDCRLTVGRDLRSPGGTILGGVIAVTGSLIVGSIGSDAEVASVIELGDLPILQTARAKVVAVVEQARRQLLALTEKERTLRMNPRPSAAEREQLTESSYEMSQCQHELTRWESKLAEIDRIVQTQKRLDVQVSRGIHPGVVFQVGPTTARFHRALRGPVAVFWDEKHCLVYRGTDNAVRPLSDVAHVARAPAPAGIAA